MPETTPLRYAPASEVDDLDTVVSNLEEGWARDLPEGQWPLDVARRKCPVHHREG